MMKKQLILKTLLIVFLLPVMSHAQKRIKGNGKVITTERHVGNFHKLHVSGSFDVKLIKGKPGPITIEAESNLIPYIITEVESGKLRIRWKKNISVNTREDVKLIVTAETLSEIICSGASDIKSDFVLKSDNMKLKVSGAGDLQVKIDVDNLETLISGAGDLKLSGKCTDLKATVSGAGNQKSKNLTCNKVYAKVTGAGNLKIDVKDELRATVSGAGNLKYSGNPEIIDVEAKGAGDVKKD